MQSFAPSAQHGQAIADILAANLQETCLTFGGRLAVHYSALARWAHGRNKEVCWQRWQFRDRHYIFLNAEAAAHIPLRHIAAPAASSPERSPLAEASHRAVRHGNQTCPFSSLAGLRGFKSECYRHGLGFTIYLVAKTILKPFSMVNRLWWE